MRLDDLESTSAAVGPGDSAGTSVAADGSDVEAGTLDDAALAAPIEVGGNVFDVDSESSPHPAAKARHSTVTTPIACVDRTFLADTDVAVGLKASVDGLDSIGKAAGPLEQDGLRGDGRGPLRLAASPGAVPFRMASSTGHLRVPAIVESMRHAVDRRLVAWPWSTRCRHGRSLIPSAWGWEPFTSTSTPAGAAPMTVAARTPRLNRWGTSEVDEDCRRARLRGSVK